MAKKRAKANAATGGETTATETTYDELSYIIEPLRRLAVPIVDLNLDPKNARKHDEQGIRAIAASLLAYGFREPLVVQETDDGRKIVRAGNGRLQAARLNGWEYVPAVLIREDDATATGFSLVDNRTAELSGWDEQVLSELLAGLNLDELNDDLSLMLGDLDAQASAALESVAVPVRSGRGRRGRSTTATGSKAGEQTGSPTTSPPRDKAYKLLVTCKDENHQMELQQRLEGEQLAVKAIIGLK